MKNNTRWNGETRKFENAAAAAAATVKKIPDPVAHQPTQPPKDIGYFKIPGPQATPQANPPHRAISSRVLQLSPQKKEREFELPFAWMFRPAGRRREIAPAKRLVLVGLGLGIVLFSAYLTNIVTIYWFGTKDGENTPASITATIAIACIFMAVEIWLWVGGHSLIIWFLIAPLLAFDIYLNVKGLMIMLDVLDTVRWYSEQWFLLAAAGAACALIGEKLMSEGWRD